MGNSGFKLAFAEASSKFSRSETDDMGRVFNRLRKRRATEEGIDVSTFRWLLRRTMSDSLARLFFASACTASSATLTYENYVILAASTCKAPLDFRLQAMLSCFNADARHVVKVGVDRKTASELFRVVSESARLCLGLELMYESPPNRPPTPDEFACKIRSAVEHGFGESDVLRLDDFKRLMLGWPQFVQYIAYCFEALFVLERRRELPPMLARKILPRPPKQFPIGGEARAHAQVLSPHRASIVVKWLPVSLRGAGFYQLYSSVDHGFSLSTMLFLIERKPNELVKNAFMLVVLDRDGHIFGAYTTEPFKKDSGARYYGDNKTFLFSLGQDNPSALVEGVAEEDEPAEENSSSNEVSPSSAAAAAASSSAAASPSAVASSSATDDQVSDANYVPPEAALKGVQRRYRATGRDANFIFTSARTGLGLGGKPGFHGLELDTEFRYGTWRFCETFCNDPLAGAGVGMGAREKFRVKRIELWGFVEAKRLGTFEGEHEDEGDDGDGQDDDSGMVSRRSILAKGKQDQFILDMIGRNASVAFRGN
jgi:TLD